MLRKFLKIYLHLVIAIVAIVILVVIASFGYWLISGREYSFFDSFYMTMITLTTIGYGEIIDLSNNPGGRLFTIIIALTGISLMTYILTNLTAMIVEGKLTDPLRRRRMENKVQKLKDHYIVCGVGSIGSNIVNELHATMRQFVMLDTSAAVLQNYAKELPDAVFFEGDATDNEVLIKAGIERAAGIFASTPDDNQNLVISLSARQLNHGIRIVARCSDIKNHGKLMKAGADAVISPTHIGALRMSSEMVRPTAVSFLDIMLRDASRNLRVEEVYIPDNHVGKNIGSLNLKRFTGTLVLAVRSEGNWTYNPPESHIFKPGDTLIVMTNPEERHKLQTALQMQ